MSKIKVPLIEIGGETVETAGHTSKGNQRKWYQYGWWYKTDAFGYESLAEITVTRLLQETDRRGYV